VQLIKISYTHLFSRAGEKVVWCWKHFPCNDCSRTFSPLD